MGRTHGVRQRVLLALLAVVLMAAGLLLSGLHFGWFAFIGDPGDVSGEKIVQDSPADNVWSISAVVAGALALLLGLWWMLSLIPSRTHEATFRYHDGDSVGVVPGSVLEREAQSAAERIAGVSGASIRLTGSASSPGLMASINLSPESPFDLTRDELLRRVVRPLETMIGSSFESVNIRYTSNRSARVSSTSDVELS